MKARILFTLTLLGTPLPFALAAKPASNSQTREPIGVLVNVGRNAELLLDHAETRMPAHNGDLVYRGYRLVTGGSRTSYTSFPEHLLYTLSPSLSAPRADSGKYQIDRKNDLFDLQFDSPHSILKKVRVADERQLAYPLFYPFARATLPGGDMNALQKELNAHVSDPVIRLSMAALQERLEQLVPALHNYQLLSADWKDAKWLGEKIPVLRKDIGIANAKGVMAGRSPRSFAVVVGISKYERLPHLGYADRDATFMAEFLTDPKGGGLDRNDVTVLTNEAASGTKIRNAIATVLEKKAGPQDTLYIFLSGRGFVQNVGGSRRGYFMGYNSDPQEKRASAYAIADLAELLRKQLPRLRQVFLFADIERAGQTASSADSINEAVVQQIGQPNGRLKALLASAPGKPSGEMADLAGGHGIFGYYLVAGLKGEARQGGAGEITAGSLFSYVSQRVAEATSGKQKPGSFGTLDDATPVLRRATLAQRPRTGFQLLASLAHPAFPPIGFLALLGPEDQNARSDAENEAEALEAEGQQVILKYLRGYEQPQNKKEFDRAADLFGRAAALNPSAYLQARQLFCEGRFRTMNKEAENAIPLLQRAILLDPDGGYSFNALGIAYLELQRFQEAAWAFRDAIVRAPTWVYPRHNLALAYSEAGIRDGAERTYRDAIRIAPDYASLHYNLGLFYQKLNRRDDAKAEYGTALKLNPSLPDAYAGVATLQAAGGGKSQELAYSNYRHALDLQPESLPFKHDLALLYWKQRKSGEAIRLWREILHQDSHFVPSRLELASALAAEHRFHEAGDEYREVLAQRAGFIGAQIALHEVLGDEQAGAGTKPAAVAEYKVALELTVDEDDRRRLKRKLQTAQK